MPLSPTIERDRIRWDIDDPASQGLLEPLFDDMGMGQEDTRESQLARAAAREYCICLIKNGSRDEIFYTMGEMQMTALHFYQGYLECLTSGRAT